MKRTPQGMSHGETAPAGQPIVAIKLRPGWVLQPDGATLVYGSRRIEPALPAGATLVPSMPVPAGGRRSRADAELARFLHLRLPAGASVEQALKLARGWEFVERAARPPAPSLP